MPLLEISLFKFWENKMIMLCVSKLEIKIILQHWHDRKDFMKDDKTTKVLDVGFLWPTLFKDA